MTLNLSPLTSRLARFPWATVAWIVAATLAVLVAIYVVVAGQMIGVLGERRADVAGWLGDRLGMVAQVDRIDGEMDFLTPVVHLRGVRFYVKNGEAVPAADAVPALAAPAIDLEVDTLASLLAWKPVLRRLRVQGIDLVLVEGEDGRFRVRGMPFNVNDPQAEEKLRRALLVLYRQNDILVERSRLSIESTRVPVTALENLRLHMHNDDNGHAVSGSALVAGPGQVKASFVLRFEGQPVVPRDLVADLYLRIQPTSLENWVPRRDAGALWIDALSGGGEAWLRLEHAKLVAVTGKLQVDSLAVSLEDGRKLEGLLGLGARFRWLARDDGWTLAVGGLTFRRQGATWPESDGALDLRRDDAGNLRVRAMLSQGDVRMLAGFADALPEAQAALRERIARMAPEGQVSALRVEYDAAAEPASRWRLRSGFAGLALRADGKLPGISGLSGKVELVPDAGFVDLAVTRAQLALPETFASPLAIDDMKMRAAWRRGFGGWRIASDRFTLRNADARASGMFALEVPPGGESPRLHLLGLIEDGKATAAPRYLPLGTSEAFRGWFGSALGDGRLRRGSFLFEGPMRRDPALLRERTFQMRFEGDGIAMNYLAGWPPLRNADLDLHLENGVVEASSRQANLLASIARDVRVSIVPQAPPAGSAGKAASTSRLDVNAHIDGDVEDLFTIFRDSPLKASVPAELLRWTGSGRLQADLEVNSVLGVAGSVPRVAAAGTISGATLTSPAHALEISDASGNVRYDSVKGFFAEDLRGRALESEFAGRAYTAGDPRAQGTVIDLRGPLRMAPLSAWLKLPALDLLRGEANAELQLRFGHGGDSLLDVRSDLRGIAIAAPAPLAKPAGSALDTRLMYTLGTDTPRLTLVYGKQFAADMQIRNGAPFAGAVMLGGTKLPEAGSNGLVIEGSVAELKLGEWMTFTRRLAGLAPVPESAPFTVSGAVSGIVALGGVVQRIAVDAGRVDAGGFPLEDAQLLLARQDAGWQLRVDSRTLDGQVLLPDGYQERGDKPLVIQVDQLALPASTGGSFVEPSPASIPRMSLALQNLSIGNDSYGNWSLETIPDGNGVRLVDVQGTWRALDIQGDGRWAPAGEGTRTQFTGISAADDVARVSEAFGFAPNLSSSKAIMTFDVGWPGSPLRADPLAARGTLSVEFRDGRFVTASAKTQALRAFGVFNISTWQRRLKLDFSDLYKKGVAFDSITGDLALDNGRLDTANLVVKSPSALFEMSGSTDLKSEAIDGRLRVTLPVNSNLYVGCLAGLPACAGIVVAEQLWGDKLEKMTTLAYDVKGVWDDPKIEQIEGGEKKGGDRKGAGQKAAGQKAAEQKAVQE